MNTNTKDAVQKAMQRLFDKHGGQLTPSIVLDAATNKRSPLHSQFEWDDSKAGHEYRLIQSRKLCRVVRLDAGDGQKQQLVNIARIESGESREGVYKAPSAIVQSKTEFQIALESALTRLNAAQRAVDELRGAASDDDALSKIILAYEALSTANTALSAVH